jgi:hypothetical protein
MTSFLFSNTHSMHIKIIIHGSIAMLSLKTTYTLAGFEPGSSVLEPQDITGSA